MTFHIDFANVSGVPADFFFLHQWRTPFSISGDVANRKKISDKISMAFSADVNDSREDVPLCARVREMIRQIEEYKPKIGSGQKIVLFIATQGLPSDGDIQEALQPLNGSPVHLVVRLCSDDAELKSAWRSIRSGLNIKVDIISGLSVESSVPKNKWLSYGEPLRQFREMGGSLGDVSFTQIDEELLSFGEMKKLCEKM
jgi:hypothetical protein